MARIITFKAFDLQRKKQHKLSSPPEKINSHRLDVAEWKRAAANKGSGSVKKARGKCKTTKKTKVPRTALDVVRCKTGEVVCLWCKKAGDSPECGTKCYRAFRREHFIPDKVEIRGPGPLGYGAYLSPSVRIKKGQWLDEYIGVLHPLSVVSESRYRIEIPKTCAVDSEKAGNWTRFINSSCQPNVKPWGDFVAGRHVVLFQALRDIEGDEELTFNYGRAYFEGAKLKCACAAVEGPHLPGTTKPR